MVSATLGREHYRTELTATGHTLLADEPEELGGQHTGPSPGQLLMMSLASCTAITLRMYADRKQWPLERVHVEVDFRKEDGKTIFEREVQLNGALDEEQRQRLMQIANACPIHKLLTGPMEINTSLKSLS